MPIKCFLGFLLFITIIDEHYGQVHRNGNVEVVFRSIYDLKLKSADSLINQFDDGKPVWSLLKANVSWWRILCSPENKALNDLFVNQLEETKVEALKLPEENNERAYYIILVNAFRTRYDLLNDNYLTAAGYLNSCIDDVTKSFGLEEVYEPFQLTSGLYYYFMEKAYEDYFLMRPYLVFFPDGDKEVGLNYLKDCFASDDLFLHTESTYFLMRICLDMEEDLDQALFYANMLLRSYPENAIFQLLALEVYDKISNEAMVRNTRINFEQAVLNNDELSKAQRQYLLELHEKL